MKQGLMKVFLISIVTTVVYYGYITLLQWVDINPTWLSDIFSILCLYGALFISLSTLNFSREFRFVTFKYGFISTLSKWLLFYAGIILNISNGTIVILIILTAFLISFAADIMMLVAIKKADIPLIQEHIKKHQTTLTEQDIINKEHVSKYVIHLIILLGFTSIIIQRVNYFYDILFHLMIIYFGIAKLYKNITYTYSFKLTIPYVTLTYIGALLLSYFSGIFDTVWLTLPLAVVIYMPFIVFYIKELVIIENYHEI